MARDLIDVQFDIYAAHCRAEDELRRRLEIYDRLVPGVRNIIYNVEQNPAGHTVEGIVASLRNALGLKPGEKV